jgi:protease IV
VSGAAAVAAVAAAGIVTSTTTTTRNRPRRPRTVIGVALGIYLGVLALFVVVLSGSLGSGAGGGAVFGARIAVVELDGPILEVEDLVRELRAHRDNPLVRAVVVRINSPGGVVGPTQELHAALTRMREARKPVVASLGAVAASGGYYVAVAADRIYANPGTLTGSIGVIMRLATLDGLMKKVGVEYVVVKSGRLKDIGNIARAMSPEERQVLQVLLDDVHGQFITAVAEGRKLDRAQVLGFADGRIVSGAQAKALNMVDVLGGLEEALDGAATLAGLPKPPMVVGPRRRLSVFDFLRNQLAQAGWLAMPPALPLFKTPLYLMD